MVGAVGIEPYDLSRGAAFNVHANSGCIGISCVRRPQEVHDQRLTNDMGESNANIHARTIRKKPKNSGPGRTRTSNQTVMSGRL
jgi:hypothetical protein